MEKFFHDNFQLIRPIRRYELHDAEAELRERIRQRHAHLHLISSIKPVAGGGDTIKYFNVRIDQVHQGLIFYEQIRHETFFMFYLSDKFEPFVILTVVSSEDGCDRFHRKLKLDLDIVNRLPTCMKNFLNNFHLSNGNLNELQLHYTKEQERENSDGVGSSFRAHSENWHLKIRISSQFYKDKLPIMQFVRLDELRSSMEMVKYQFERQVVSFNEIMEMLKSELQT
jgi:hypothetical protein